MADDLVQGADEFRPRLLVSKGDDPAPQPIGWQRCQIEDVQDHLDTLDAKAWRESVLCDPRRLAADQGCHETCACAIKAGILKHDDERDDLPLPPRVPEDVELGQGSERRELIAEKAVLTVEQAEAIDHLVEDRILVATARALTVHEVTQKILERAAEIAVCRGAPDGPDRRSGSH